MRWSLARLAPRSSLRAKIYRVAIMPDKIDCFVIMGAAVKKDGSPSGAMRRRVEAALALSKDCHRPCYLPTGGVGRYGPAEAEVMKKLLSEAGVPECSILIDTASHTTLSSVIRCADILRAHGHIGSVTVCSDTYHQPRCRWLFSLLGIATRKAALPSGRQANGTIRWLYYHLRELVAILFDTLLLFIRHMLRRPAR